MAAVSVLKRSGKNRAMVVDYADDLKLFPSGLSKVGVLALVVVYFTAPAYLSPFQLNVVNIAGGVAIGALGLNLLTGYTGQVSLGHAFFLAIGGYAAGYLGAEQGWHIALWLPAAAVLGAVIGAVVGPFALRLRGNYLVIVTLGLVFVGGHLYRNWESVTGGSNGLSTVGAFPTLDGATVDIFGSSYDRDQAYFWLIWAFVAVAAILAKNITRSRPGRAMQAIRDRDVAAEVIGVSLSRYKVGAFAVSSAFAGVAGALLAVYGGRAAPENFTLLVSIQYVAIIIIGGIGTILGSIVGALVLGALPRIVESVSRERDLPFVAGDRGGPDGFIQVFSLNKIIYGILIVLFLILEPHGLAAVWLRIKAWFRTWPFSY